MWKSLKHAWFHSIHNQLHKLRALAMQLSMRRQPHCKAFQLYMKRIWHCPDHLVDIKPHIGSNRTWCWNMLNMIEAPSSLELVQTQIASDSTGVLWSSPRGELHVALGVLARNWFHCFGLHRSLGMVNLWHNKQNVNETRAEIQNGWKTYCYALQFRWQIHK